MHEGDVKTWGKNEHQIDLDIIKNLRNDDRVEKVVN